MNHVALFALYTHFTLFYSFAICTSLGVAEGTLLGSATLWHALCPAKHTSIKSFSDSAVSLFGQWRLQADIPTYAAMQPNPRQSQRSSHRIADACPRRAAFASDTAQCNAASD